MQLHDLSPVPGSNRKRKRIGCGLGSGHGKTACRGTKGDKSRTGGGVKPGFEGGQMPITRRVPKRGFSNFRHAVTYQVVNIGSLEKNFEPGAEVTLDALMSVRLIRNVQEPVKILGNGELTKPLTVRAHAFSESATRKIESVGGKAEVI